MIIIEINWILSQTFEQLRHKVLTQIGKNNGPYLILYISLKNLKK